ncbi:F0F1 ATP synthase subunit delta [Helicobacter turcicus]|uniref:F0F1 ATP synthase subunit delta n=1 Tax=Helicobacter turcicus TaxID=2867412 RepID=A0ABS7JL03_9HELI|nr:F0F1 ATP synthase subunit delta [Helicobacter turcicus]MBX7490074.1 F0F1 ATP synthase subunit delta [Helicobacter turcicus]MBX7544933.1 F0F1 ATP synthase subunit delta [Helicobacter turcicus]
MKDLIAKRYIKALVASVSQKELGEIAPLLGKLAEANTISKFKEIIESPYVATAQKVDFILKNILDNSANTKFVNFVKVLAEHKRLGLFGELHGELSSYLATLNKEYIAQLIVNDGYEDSVLKEIESKFSKKLGVNLVLEQQVVANSGIKLVVEDLGVEVSFSQEKFISDLRNHILKAF